MKEVQLTRGYVALVDDADFVHVSQYKWCARIATHGRTAYAARTVCVNGSRRSEGMHRFLLQAPEGFEVDHVDGNGLNNTRADLRLATRAENGRNRQRQRNSTSGYISVTWHKAKDRWGAQIKVAGEQKHLGYFDTPEAAARVRDAAAVEHHGEFARLNFPRSALPSSLGLSHHGRP